MITRIEGQLAAVHDDGVELLCGHVTHELLICSCDLPDLVRRVGETVQFCTLEYLEGQNQGTSFIPRLIGFRSAEQRDFFELFTTVKGFGARKTLRALRLPVGRIAEAIASRDVSLLSSLPEIGKRTAETIIAALHGKVDRFIELKPAGGQRGENGEARMEAPNAIDRSRLRLIDDAVAVLVQLGEPRLQARTLIDRVLVVAPEIGTADELISACMRLREP